MPHTIGKTHTYSLMDRLPGYSPLSILTRLVIFAFIASGLLYLIQLFVHFPEDLVQTPLIGYFIVYGAFILLAEFQIVLDKIMERILPIPYKLRLRLFAQMFLGFVLMLIEMKVVSAYVKVELADESTRLGVYVGFGLSLFFIYMMANALIITRFSEKWIESERQMDAIKQEKLMMDYNSLQDQLNPHFLFNNLSVLKSLIIYDQKTALQFTEDFTDVYRYVLESKDKILIKLVDELQFINAYLGLHKERLGEGLIVKMDLEKSCMHQDIAPLTLQLLVENAIKHNIASKSQALTIEIIGKVDSIAVINTLQLKDSSYSTNTGLKNLIQRYKMLCDKPIEILSSKEEFMVKIPLI